MNAEVCATCASFTVTTDDELRGEALEGEHPDFRSPGRCEQGEDCWDDVLGMDSCVDWTKRTTRWERLWSP